LNSSKHHFFKVVACDRMSLKENWREGFLMSTHPYLWSKPYWLPHCKWSAKRAGVAGIALRAGGFLFNYYRVCARCGGVLKFGMKSDASAAVRGVWCF
jgi:hypothetical protein